MDKQNTISDDILSFKEIHSKVIVEKANFDKIMDINSPIKNDRVKNLMNKKKLNSDNALENKNKLEEVPKFDRKIISWDYNKMISNLRFCIVPRFLIIEVKYICETLIYKKNERMTIKEE